MSITVNDPTTDFVYSLLVPHPDDGRLLVIREDGGWTLPQYRPDEHHFGVVGHINTHMAQQYGLQTVVLRCLGEHRDEADERVRRYYALEMLSTMRQAQPVEWLDASTLIHQLPEDQAEWLVAWQHWTQRGEEIHAPWMQPGWFAEAQMALRDFADRMDMSPGGPVEQVRVWARSAVLRLHTEQDDLYLKAVPVMFGHEPVITRVLALRYPGRAPEVRAVNVEKAWMMMSAFSGQPLLERHDLAAWENAVRQFAEIQVDLARSTRALIALGMPDRHLDLLASQVERLAADLPTSLSSDEQDRFRRSARLLRSMCYELLDYDLPLTLLHGDFWPDNVVIPQGDDAKPQQPLFFDWSDACISHPFFDLPFFIDLPKIDLPDADVPNIQAHLREVYLSVWTGHGTLQSLRGAYRLAQVLGPLHYAMTYHRYVLPGMAPETRWEMADLLPYLIRRTLTAFDAYQANKGS